jgi:hypothetical protein
MFIYTNFRQEGYEDVPLHKAELIGPIENPDKETLIEDKWVCPYMIKLPTGTTIYFANVKTLREVYDTNFTSAVMNRSEDYYVLTPDTYCPGRTSVLIMLDLGDQKIATVHQTSVFDFWHYNPDEKHQLIAMAREMPEIYPMIDITNPIDRIATIDIVDIYMTNGHCYTVSYQLDLEKQPFIQRFPTDDDEEYAKTRYNLYAIGWSDQSSSLRMSQYNAGVNVYNGFIMQGRYAKRHHNRGTREMMFRPATTFVLDENNIIIVNNNWTVEDIVEFFQNVNIPPSVSIVWVDPKNVCTTAKMYAKLANAERKFKYSFIGFPFEMTLAARVYSAEENT